MAMTDQLWQYAKEAILSACDANTDEDRQNFLELARVLTQAAMVERRSLADHDTTARAA
jgi:hypothetical protein